LCVDNRLVTPRIELPESTRKNPNVNYNILSYNNSIEGTSTSHVFYFSSFLTTTARFGPPPPPPTTTTLERVFSYRYNIIILYGIFTYLLKFNSFYSSPSQPNTWLHFFFMYSYTYLIYPFKSLWYILLCSQLDGNRSSMCISTSLYKYTFVSKIYKLSLGTPIYIRLFENNNDCGTCI